MKASSCVFVLTAAIAVGLPAASARSQDGGKTDIKTTLKQGEVYYFRQKMSMTQTVHMGEMNFDTKVETVQFTSWTIGAVRPDGGADVKVTFGRCTGKLDNQMIGSHEFDSGVADDNNEDNPMISGVGKSMTAMAGATFDLKLSPRGDATEVKGLKEVMQKAMSGLPGAENAMAAGSMLDDEQFKQQMKQGWGTIPEGGAAIGQSWSSDTSIGKPLPMSIHADYKLASADAEKVTIDVVMKIALDTKADATPNPMMPTGMKLDDAKGTGTIVRSRKDGLLQSSTMDQAMNMAMEMQGQKMKSEQTVKTSLERVAAADFKAQPVKKEEVKPASAPAAAPTPK